MSKITNDGLTHSSTGLQYEKLLLSHASPP